ncbi:MAG TPA: butyryl-CoA:acetate CoA-transferase [Syntrophomonadaceae bacterium]|nr:butyryl-CoA:acetate CoA-transferase [Syntrophomonadaceae bacterium]
MSKSVWDEYKSKLTTADEAVKIVKSGDHVGYGECAYPTRELDKALARRKDELRDIYIMAGNVFHYLETVKADPTQEHFILNNISFSPWDRRMQEDGLDYIIPSVLHEYPCIFRDRPVDVAFVSVTPMNKKGYFNLSTQGVKVVGELKHAKHIIVEVHDKLPLAYGNDNWLHISRVDAIVEIENSDLPIELPVVEPDEVDIKIAQHIAPLVEDGACLQLGVGGTPNQVGKFLAQSDVEDLGVHTELICDAYLELFAAGKITNQKKNIDQGMTMCSFALGSRPLYDFIDDNPSVNIACPSYTNDPWVIMQNDKVMSICMCMNVDLLGQISAESVGRKQVSGTGGLMDFHYAAYHSKGGKGILCLHSARKNNKTGKIESNIVPAFLPGTLVTMPASLTSYVATEYGIVNLKGKSSWERAEGLISISHPDCQDDLVKAAKEANIWRKTNKR